MRKGRANIRTDKEILEALKSSKTQLEAQEKLGVAHCTLWKYIQQLKSKGLLNSNNKPIP